MRIGIFNPVHRPLAHLKGNKHNKHKDKVYVFIDIDEYKIHKIFIIQKIYYKINKKRSETLKVGYN